MKMTSAQANKKLKQLEDEKNYLLNQEVNGRFYTASVKEEPIVPDYNYMQTADQIENIDIKIKKIKHAININNTLNEIDVSGVIMTVDQILIEMAQLNKRKGQLQIMRSHAPVERVKSGYYGGSTVKDPEYEYANYDVSSVKLDYEVILESIMQMQLALDHYNQTFEFEVDID